MKTDWQTIKRICTRRGFIESIAALPVFGVFLAAFLKKVSIEDHNKEAIISCIYPDNTAPSVLPKTTLKGSKELLRVGIIGFGGRGEFLARGVGYAHPSWMNARREASTSDKRYFRIPSFTFRDELNVSNFLGQEDLNAVITGVCDVYNARAEYGMTAASNTDSPNKAIIGHRGPKRYRHYLDLIRSSEVDAVIIAAPDHWHARMAIAAANEGKHVYSEKCMTRTLDEAKEVYDTISNSRIVYQLGHQNREAESYDKARDLIARNVLGQVTFAESTGNYPYSVSTYDIPGDATCENIDWELFHGYDDGRPFDPRRFFAWRMFYDYGTGLCGDLFSHDYDAFNQMLGLGIPETVFSGGGIYRYDDGREAPDTMQIACQFPGRGFSFLQSITQGSMRNRNKLILGTSASMEIGRNLSITPDIESEKYRDLLDGGIATPDRPMYTYGPGSSEFDAVTSASDNFFAGNGLMYTFREGKRFDTTHLHIKNWIDCIRNGGEPSCCVERGFEEAVTSIMAHTSYVKGRPVRWDREKRTIEAV